MNPSRIDNNQAAFQASFMQKAFPVPRSLILSEVAVDISDGNIKHFELNRTRGQVSIKGYGSSAFPIFHLGSLTEKMRNEVVASLSGWAQKTKCFAARVVIHEDEAYVFKVSVPTVDKTEIRAAIEALLEENVPVSPGEAVFEFDVVSTDVEAGVSVVAVSVLSKKEVGELIDLFNRANIEVVSVETESRALSRALLPKNDRGVHAVISIAEHHSLIFILEKGAVVFSSSLEVGSVDLDQAIAKEFGIAEEAARALKMEKAFMESDGDMKLFEAMAPIFSIIQDELGKMLIYWKAQTKKNKATNDISNIVLSGEDALIAGFARYISINSKIPAKSGSVWTNVLSVELAVPDILYRDSFAYGTVIGALI